MPAEWKLMKGRPIFKLKWNQDGAPSFRMCEVLCLRSVSIISLQMLEHQLHTSSPLEYWHTWAWPSTGKTSNWTSKLLSSTGSWIQMKSVTWWELQEGLYGMKQGGLVWNKTLNGAMLACGFTRLKSEHCIYFCKSADGVLLIAIHVDDFFTIASSKDTLQTFKAKLHTKWEVAELGNAHFCIMPLIV